MEKQFGMQPVLRSLSSQRERDLVPPLKPEQDYFTSFPNTGMKRTSQVIKGLILQENMIVLNICDLKTGYQIV